nr:unnamed protein product [Callosobruchus analis]
MQSVAVQANMDEMASDAQLLEERKVSKIRDIIKKGDKVEDIAVTLDDVWPEAMKQILAQHPETLDLFSEGTNLNRSREAHDMAFTTSLERHVDIIVACEPNKKFSTEAAWLTDTRLDVAIYC